MIIAPENVQVIDPISVSVLPTPDRGARIADTANTPYLDLSEHAQLFSKPFVVYAPEFLQVLGPSPSLRVVAEESSFPFAHEAGVWIPATREVFFTSNQYKSDPKQKYKQIAVSKIKIPEEPSSNYKWTSIDPTPGVIGGNGGCNYNGGVLLCQQGTGDVPGALVQMDVCSPYKTKVILNNFHGRPFNGPNDVVVLPLDGTIWFTDPDYAQLQGLRQVKRLPNQVYSFNPSTGSIRVVADGISNPNGITFSPDYKTCYITDTRAYGVGGTLDDVEATIYAFDVVASSNCSGPDRPYILQNKRVFAFADTAAPDGIKCDSKGNVYSGCMDGLHIWNSDGTLIGKIMIPNGIANFCFTDPGRLILLNENRILEAMIDADGAFDPR